MKTSDKGYPNALFVAEIFLPSTNTTVLFILSVILSEHSIKVPVLEDFLLNETNANNFDYTSSIDKDIYHKMKLLFI